MSYLRYIFTISLFAYLCLFNAARVMSDNLPEWKAAYVPEGEIWKYTEQHFIFNNGTDPETLDPHLMTGLPEMRLAEALFRRQFHAVVSAPQNHDALTRISNFDLPR